MFCGTSILITASDKVLFNRVVARRSYGCAWCCALRCRSPTRRPAMASKTRTGRGVAGRPGRCYELTDEGFERIELLLPRQYRGGR